MKGKENRTNMGQSIVPALLVRDMKAMIEFYAKMGFRLSGCFPNDADPAWAEVRRDSVVFQFHTEAPDGTPSSPVFSGTFYVLPESVEALAEEFRGKMQFAWGPEVMDYGMLEFGIQDPSGYYLAFAEPV